MKKVKLLLLFLFWIIPFCFIACSDDEIGGGSGNDDGIWIDVAASSANWDGEKRADISYQLWYTLSLTVMVINVEISEDLLQNWITSMI